MPSGPPWKRHGWDRHQPPWWPEEETWPPRPPGPQAWGTFGKRMAKRLVAVTLLGMFGLSLVGGFVAARVVGGGPVGVGLVWVVVAAVVMVAASARFARRSVEPVQTLVDDADRHRRQLLADVGHELRTPLAIIRGEMEAMADGVRPVSTETVAGLLADIDTMERLLEDLRVLSTAESGRLVLATEPTGLRDLAEDLVSDLGPQADAAGVSLVLREGAEVTADVDPVRIRGILGNLLVNAIRASPQDAAVEVVVADGAQGASVQVADRGAGIAPGDLERVFDRFHKGAGSRGSGLGLTISRQYARAHGGDLVAASRPGGGTTFTLTLPPAGTTL